jgi:hypothetical protein
MKIIFIWPFPRIQDKIGPVKHEVGVGAKTLAKWAVLPDKANPLTLSAPGTLVQTGAYP